MKTPRKRSFVIGISSVSGGGKTAVAEKVAELLQDAVTLHFDDYDDSTIHPKNLQTWLEAGADYNAWKTPVLTDHLRSLVEGNHITSPVDGAGVPPTKYIVFDAPLGRAHLDTGRFIDLMVFIDTPLDVAMARRLLRNIPCHGEHDAEGAIQSLRADLSSYLTGARLLYCELVTRMRQHCDLVLDGCMPLDELAGEIHASSLSEKHC